MKKFILFVFVCLFVSYTQAFAKVAAGQKQMLWHYLSKMQTYGAHFNQETIDDRGRVIQSSQGKMALKKPGYLRWETLSPTHQQLIVNKNTVWIYDVDLAQASKNVLNAKDRSNPGTLLSSSIVQIQKQFSIDSVHVKNKLACFVLHQKQVASHELITSKKITLCFKNGILQSMTLMQGFDGQTRFVFSNIRLNRPLSISLFQFVPPQGIEIINQSGM